MGGWDLNHHACRGCPKPWRPEHCCRRSRPPSPAGPPQGYESPEVRSLTLPPVGLAARLQLAAVQLWLYSEVEPLSPAVEHVLGLLEPAGG
jgi:hypothetical protein